MVLLLVVLVSMAIGAWRGLVFEVISVLGWVASFFVAQWYAPWAASHLPLAGASATLRYAAGFAVVFIAVVVVCGLLAVLLRKVVEGVGLRPIDRVLGAGFGLLRAVVLLMAAALVVGMTPLKEQDAWRQSVGASWLNAGLSGLRGMMPEDLARRLQ